MNEDLVSIIMPAYNASEFINDAIEGILNQTHQNFEFLICDDASLDDTLHKITQYSDSRIKRFSNEKNIGYLKTCNFLASQAKGEYITFQDADDVSHIERIELQLDAIKKENVDLIGTSGVVQFGTPEKRNVSVPLAHIAIIKRFSSLGSRCFIPASIMFRSLVYQKIGLYREEFNRIGAEDYDWILRASESFILANIPQICYFYRDNPNSLSRTWQSDVNNIANMSPFIAYKMYLARASEKDEMVEYIRYTKNYHEYPILHLVICRRLLETRQYRKFIKMFMNMIKKYKFKIIQHLDFWILFKGSLRIFILVLLRKNN